MTEQQPYTFRTVYRTRSTVYIVRSDGATLAVCPKNQAASFLFWFLQKENQQPQNIKEQTPCHDQKPIGLDL